MGEIILIVYEFDFSPVESSTRPDNWDFLSIRVNEQRSLKLNAFANSD